MKFEFDAALFAKAVRDQGITLGGMTVREAASAACVSPNTIFRAMHRQPINIGNFLALCQWMNTNPYAFYLPQQCGTVGETGQSVEVSA